MQIIDLSTPIYDEMPVFPGDPDVRVESIEQEIEGNPWYMRQITMCTHDATHVNVPAHIKVGAANLDAFALDRFFGPAVRYESDADLQEGVGVIFDAQHDLTMDIAERVVAANVPFIGVTNDFDLAVERYTLAHGVISYERLVNTEQLRKEFTFYGVPLPIREGDGSPVRAFAVISA